MKNSVKLLAGAVAAVTAFGAQAAQIYNKNDTTLDITGQVEAVYWSGHNHANGDQTISNRARFGLEGRTKLAGDIYGFGKFEQQWENEEDSSGTNESSRDQYVGVDFGQGGVITAGRFLNNEYKIESVTDYYEYNAAYGEQYGDRNSGKINYAISYNGFSAALEYQSAVNNFSVGRDVDRGYSAVLGYTSPDVVFGPIGVQLGAGYLKYQNDSIADGEENYLDKSHSFGVSLSWGNYGSGLYLASFYEQTQYEFGNDNANSGYKVKSSETLVAYTFDNGIGLHASYQINDKSSDADDSSVSSIVRKVPLMVTYDINPNFRVWVDDMIDAGSSDDNSDDNLFTAGARFIF